MRARCKNVHSVVGGRHTGGESQRNASHSLQSKLGYKVTPFVKQKTIELKPCESVVRGFHIAATDSTLVTQGSLGPVGNSLLQ